MNQISPSVPLGDLPQYKQRNESSSNLNNAHTKQPLQVFIEECDTRRQMIMKAVRTTEDLGIDNITRW